MENQKIQVVYKNEFYLGVTAAEILSYSRDFITRGTVGYLFKKSRKETFKLAKMRHVEDLRR